MKRKIVFITVLAVIVYFLSSCHSGRNQETKPFSDNSTNALDWNGTYFGILPCSSCEGIETVITLNKDNTYSMIVRYLGESNQSIQTQGGFKWNTAGNTVTLMENKGGKKHYFVGENQIIQLDKNGNRVSGSLAGKYVLKKRL